MQLSTPQKTAIVISFFISLSVAVTLIIANYFTWTSLNVSQIVIFLVVLTFLSYTISLFIIRDYLYDKIRLIYKTLSRQKGSSNEVETDLNKVNEDIDRMVAERQREIDDLKNTETFRREFIGNVSHELKTPIFNIQGYIHTLMDGAIKDDNVNIKYLKRTSKSVDRMINIVDDLEIISKIESNRLELEFLRWNIVSHVQELFEILEIKAQKRGINLSIINESSSGFVEADKDKISQVLVNLIENSIKYGKENGTTKVRFYEMGENMLVEIADNGNGISEEHLPRLFERFYRVDKSRSRDEGGTGLGLSIVKHIIEAHRQTINVRSTESVGTTFSFTVKRSQ
ncbi:MAG: sensor histidine kinase [Flavobacteriales bacterium]